METIWNIRLSELPNGKFRVDINGEGGRSSATDTTPDGAYRAAEYSLIVKPGFVRSQPVKEAGQRDVYGDEEGI